MSELTTSVRKSVSGHWLLTAIAAAVVIAALVTALVVAMTGSSSGNSTSNAPSIGGSGTNLQDNSFCQGTNRLQFGAC